MSKQASFNGPWCVDAYQSVRSRNLRKRCSQLKNRSATQRCTPKPLPCSEFRLASAVPVHGL